MYEAARKHIEAEAKLEAAKRAKKIAQKHAWQLNGDEKVYSVGELANEHHVSTRSLRFYEEQGLLNPLRRGRTRFFTQTDRVRLKLVLRGKRLGFSLAEIKEIVLMYDAKLGETRQLKLLINTIAEKRDILEQRQRDLDITLREMQDVEEKCLSKLREIEAEERR